MGMLKTVHFLLLVFLISLFSSCQDTLAPNKFIAARVKPSQKLAKEISRANEKSGKKNRKRLKKEKKKSIKRQRE